MACVIAHKHVTTVRAADIIVAVPCHGVRCKSGTQFLKKKRELINFTTIEPFIQYTIRSFCFTLKSCSDGYSGRNPKSCNNGYLDEVGHL